MRCDIRETATTRNCVMWLFLNNRNALWHMKICHDAKVVLWLLKEMTTSSSFMKIPQTAEEVAYQPMDIFCMFGDPFILQSDNGREFESKMIQNLADMWPGIRLVYGKPRYYQSQRSVERCNQDVRDMLVAWMSDNNTKTFGLSKARNTELCIQSSRQALMRLCLEQRRGFDLGILCSLKTCTL